MAKFQLDKKQILPAVGMAVASAGLFTYFVVKMTTPPPLQAAPPAPTTQTASTHGSAASPNATAATGGAPTQEDAASNPLDALMAPPMPGMRNPFIPQIVDPGPTAAKPVQEASSNIGQPAFPGVPRDLPRPGSLGPVPPMGISGGLPPVGQAPAAPALTDWTVTGVLSSTDPANRIAILRAGDVRRFVRQGDMVDSNFRLVDVSRTGVVLAQGSHRIRLPLGGFKTDTDKHKPVQSGAATGPWTGGPTSAPAGQPGQDQSAPAQPAPIQAPPAPGTIALPDPSQVAPSAGGVN